MKKLIAVFLVIITLLTLAACKKTSKESLLSNKDSEAMFVKINESPDKYTWYIKNYVGKNCASFGKTTAWDGGYRYDEYGEGKIKFVFVAEDNSFVDFNDIESLKNYVVVAQSVSPNSELKLTFAKYSDGKESETSVEKQNIEEIELYVKCIADNSDMTD